MKPIILIDNGHGYDCPGKCSPDVTNWVMDSPYRFYEYEWAREIANGCVSVLCSRGYDARLLVPEKSDVQLKNRVNRANLMCQQVGSKNVLLVSIHNNAAGKSGRWLNARGWSIYTTKGITEADKLAEEIYNVAKEEFKSPLTVRTYTNKKLGVDYEENFYILLHTYCPAVLVENFFQDNKEDVLYLKSDAGKGSCIHVICQGLENYIKKYK
jgi:N-acetylmuramoyl-L-alanine amidase